MQANLVVDVDQLRKNLNALPGAVPDIIVQRGLIEAARVAARHAKKPGFAFNDRTKAARKSIRASGASRTYSYGYQKGRTTYFAALKIGKKGAKHGSLLELGTDTMKARAPIRKATEETIGRAWRASLAAMEKAFGKLATDLKTGKVAKSYLRAARKANVSGKQSYYNQADEGFF